MGTNQPNCSKLGEKRTRQIVGVFAYAIISMLELPLLYNKFCITRTTGDQKKCSSSREFRNRRMGNGGKVCESCTSYAIIRVINVRVMQSYTVFTTIEGYKGREGCLHAAYRWRT